MARKQRVDGTTNSGASQEIDFKDRERALKIRAAFETLFAAWGAQHWWPAESVFEVIAGAFLTQNTSWNNVAKALERLRSANALSMEGIRRLEVCELEELVRPSGYFRQKAQRLKAFVRFVDENYGGSLDKMFAAPTDKLRVELLLLNGVGPETADSILLYAGMHEVFVVDAYTKRIFSRHGWIGEEAKYEEVRALVERALKGTKDEVRGTKEPIADPFVIPEKLEIHAPSAMSERPRSELASRFNEFHGLLVQVGKHHCLKAAPKCEGCPLERLLPR